MTTIQTQMDALQTGALAATSTASYALVPGSIMDLSQVALGQVTYIVSETGGVNGITVELQTSNDQQTWVTIGAAKTIGAGSSLIVGAAASGTATALGRYVQLVVEDTNSGSHGVLAGTGFAR
jgi:hypothetical protein